MGKKIRFNVNKLIRDKMPHIMVKDKIFNAVRTMENAEYIDSLKEKLIEEAREVKAATSDQELIEELADVVEVLYALIKAQAITKDSLETVRANKRERRGGFDKKIFSEYVEMDDSNPAIHYYRAQPQNYPEITCDDDACNDT